MFDIYPVKDDPSKVLVQADVRVLICLIATQGLSNSKEVQGILGTWGFSSSEAKHADYHMDEEYADVKEKIKEIYTEYCEVNHV